MTVEVQSVSHSFGEIEVLSEVTLEVRDAEVHCLLGPSGSGKSTLLRLIAGLEVLQSGTISLSGETVAMAPTRSSGQLEGTQAVAQSPPEHRSVGFVFQDYALFPHLNVLRNVMFGMAKAERRDSDSRAGEARALLDQVGMADFEGAMPHTLSGGQQQRVALARALARQPEVMLLDEPFSGLDGRLRAEVRDRTMEVLRASNVATIIVTHDPQEALLVGDVISVIEQGRVLQTGSAREIVDASNSLLVAEVFGAVNTFSTLVQQGNCLLPWGAVEAAGHAEQAPVIAMVRAEHLLLEAHVDEPRRQGVAVGRVSGVKPAYGALEVSVDLDLGGETVRAIDLARAAWRMGDRVVISAPGERVMLVST